MPESSQSGHELTEGKSATETPRHRDSLCLGVSVAYSLCALRLLRVDDLVMTATVFLVVFGLMLIEARRATRNERAQRRRGGIEASGDVYQAMRLAYPAAF